MPKGERQTTGTAQALLGAKQIAAGERASERQEAIAKKGIIADYIKTGIGTLKSVGDYLQQKQSLEQNQEALTLKQSLFSAQFGDVGEQEQRRQSEQRLREAQATDATAQADLARDREAALLRSKQAAAGLAETGEDVAKGKAPSEISLAESKARLAGTEADIAEGTKEDKIAIVGEQLRGLNLANTGQEIENKFRPALADGQIDQVRAAADKLRSEAKTIDERRKVDIAHGWAIIRELESTGQINRKKLKMLERKHQLETDPEERAKNLTQLESRLRIAQVEKVESDVRVSVKTEASRIEHLADLVTSGKVDIDGKKLANKAAKQGIALADIEIAINSKTINDRIAKSSISVETALTGLEGMRTLNKLQSAKVKTQQQQTKLLINQTEAINAEITIAFEQLFHDKQRVGFEGERVGIAREVAREDIDLKKGQLRLETWISETRNERAIEQIDNARRQTSNARLRDIDNAQLTNRGLGLDMLRFRLEHQKFGHSKEEAKLAAARFLLDHKAKYGSEEYQERFREALLKVEEAKPAQLKSAQELQELQKIPLREAAAKSIKRQRKGLTEEEAENINAAKVTVTNTMEEHPHLRDLGVGANEELGELNREGPNFRLLSAFTNLARDGIVTLDELRPHSLTTGTTEGGGWWDGAGTKGDAAFKNLGNTWHHLDAKDRPALVKHLAKTWKKGPAALDETAQYIEDNWDVIVGGHMKGSPVQNLGFVLGTRETGPAAGADAKRRFFKGLADAIRDASAAAGEGFEPDTSLHF